MKTVQPTSTPTPPSADNETKFPIVGIGASAGGLDAFKRLISKIPAKSGMAYVVVQHLRASHESLLPQLLQKVSAIPVTEITEDLKLLPDNIYVIPSDKMLTTIDGMLHLSPRKERNKVNLLIDLFFSSLAQVHEANAVGVVLSGTASDGTEGLRAIKENGGVTFAQNEQSAAYTSMPNSAVKAGVVDFLLPPEEIVGKILEITKQIESYHLDDEHLKLQDEQVFKQIILLLRVRKATDFTYYKQTTIRRRILRRMALCKLDRLSDYLKNLRENKAEQDTLYNDILIPVSSFFRDGKSFELLEQQILPQIFHQKMEGEPIRIWIAGCSTGEEAYSVAICIKELLDDKPQKVQIFATDISEQSVLKARKGLYNKTDVLNISPRRLAEFFTKTSDGFLVNKNIRDYCVFAVHNFLKDPPFSKMDLICCRNVMIYFETYLQKKALTTFHYSLQPHGYLFLGKSEAITHVPQLFTPVIKTDKFFKRKDAISKLQLITMQPDPTTLVIPEVAALPKDTNRIDFQKSTDDILLNKYNVSGVVVNESMDVVHFRGNTTNFLELSPGKPSHNLFKLAKHGLAFELRNILHKASKEKTQVVKENVTVDVNGEMRYVSIEAIPLSNTIEPHFFVLFHNNEFTAHPTLPAKRRKAVSSANEEKDLRIANVEQELAHAREDMRNITEHQEAANEELQSANEELLSSSEELQSLNEELETGKEELQSTNEELASINQEMMNLVDELKEQKDYAMAIIETMRTPLLVLDDRFRIKSANNAYYKTFHTNANDTEGMCIYDLDRGHWNEPQLINLLEKVLPEKSIFNDFEVKKDFSSIGEKVILVNGRELLINNAEKLILLAMEDVTDKREAVEQLKNSEMRYHMMIEEVQDYAILLLSKNGTIENWNKGAEKIKGYKAEEIIGKNYSIFYTEEDRKNYLPQKQLQDAEANGRASQVGWRVKKDGSLFWADGAITAIYNDKREVIGFSKVTHDLTVIKKINDKLEANAAELKQRNDELKKRNNELNSFAYISSHDLQEPLRKIQTYTSRIIESETALTEKGKNYFERIKTASLRMQNLINDLLSFSRVNTAERKFEKTNLVEIIEEVKNEYKETIDEKNATINVLEICGANVIVFQFRQLINNLIGNALKFSKTGEPPLITIQGHIGKGKSFNNDKLDADKDYCRFTISDNGIGFDPEYNERIFEVFQRLHGNFEYAGTGIGLAIVKKIVDNHNGVICATGKPNAGATFDIYLPAEQ